MSPTGITLSSRLTFFTKVIFPIAWISGFCIGTIAMWVSDNAPNQVKRGFLACLILGSLFIWWSCARLKRVRIDGRTLYISNYLREIALPLNIVEHVSENRAINIRPVTLYFRRATDFGNKILFMPKARMMWFWHSHPVVGEIRQMVERATAKGSS